MTGTSATAAPPAAAGAPLLTLLAIWGARLAWLATAWFGGAAVGAAVADRSTAVQDVATVGAWVAWAAGAVALAAPSVPTLTAARVVVPGALAVAAVAAAGGADIASLLGLVIPGVVACILTGAAETGRTWVQASAYGDEQRFPLCPPLGYLVASVATWLIWTAAVVIAPLAWAAGAWVLAAATTALAVFGLAVLPRRWHQLSQRWLVAVPAGLVVHDPVVLGETLMVTRQQIAAVTLADPARRGGTSGAADLTGPAPGLAVEITLRATETALLAPTPSQPRGRAIDLRALLVAPSRPGAVLAEAARRHLGRS